MHGIYELKEMLCKELEEYGDKREMTAGSLDIVDKLAHTVKNLDRIIAVYEEKDGYSNRGGRAYDDGRQHDGYVYRRDSRGRYARDGYARDGYSRDGYSRDDGREDMINELEGLMNDAPTPQIRKRIQELVKDIENA